MLTNVHRAPCRSPSNGTEKQMREYVTQRYQLTITHEQCTCILTNGTETLYGRNSHCTLMETTDASATYKNYSNLTICCRT